MRLKPADRGLSLLELVVVMGLLVAFLGLAHEPLLRVLRYPRQSQARFADRATATHVETTLVEAMKDTERGYLWVGNWGRGVAVLMGQAREYRPPDQSPITHYMLFAYDSDQQTLVRSELSPGAVHALTGDPLKPGDLVPGGAWPSLVALRQGRAFVGSHLLDFRFQVGGWDQPAQVDFQVSSYPDSADRPVRQVSRTLSKVGDDKKK